MILQIQTRICLLVSIRIVVLSAFINIYHYCLILTMDAVYLSKMLGSRRTAWRYNPEDRVLHSHWRVCGHLHENLKSNHYTHTYNIQCRTAMESILAGLYRQCNKMVS
jgi:hypothetical protein